MADLQHFADTLTAFGMVGLGLPLIAPDQEYFREVLGEGGLYYPDTTGGLEALLRTVCDEDLARARAALKPLQEQLAWPRVASGDIPTSEEPGTCVPVTLRDWTRPEAPRLLLPHSLDYCFLAGKLPSSVASWHST